MAIIFIVGNLKYFFNFLACSIEIDWSEGTWRLIDIKKILTVIWSNVSRCLFSIRRMEHGGYVPEIGKFALLIECNEMTSDFTITVQTLRRVNNPTIVHQTINIISWFGLCGQL